MVAVQKKKLLIMGAVALVLVGWLIYYLAQNKSARQGLPPLAQNEASSVELSEEVLKSLTPPSGAKPAELSEAVLKSLTPPAGAKPLELSEEVLKSLTPPSRYVIFER